MSVAGINDTTETRDVARISRFNPGDIPARERYAVWRESTAPIYDVEAVGTRECYSVDCDLCEAGDTVFAKVQFDPTLFRRTPRLISQSDRDVITLQYYRAGSIRGELEDGTTLLMAPDRISFQDFRRPYHGIGVANETYGVIIPRDAFEDQGRVFESWPMFSWMLDAPRGRVLMNALAAIRGELGTATAEEARQLAEGFVGLISGLLKSQSGADLSPDHDRSVLAAMKTYIQANLDRGGLDSEMLCHQFGCSRATLYRRFKDLGGLQRYMNGLRLDRCLAGLVAVSPDAGARVSSIANRWGFHDAKSFNRMFRKRFGVAPSEVLGLADQSAAASGECASGPYAEIIRQFNRILR